MLHDPLDLRQRFQSASRQWLPPRGWQLPVQPAGASRCCGVAAAGRVLCVHLQDAMLREFQQEILRLKAELEAAAAAADAGPDAPMEEELMHVGYSSAGLPAKAAGCNHS